ncbi:MULTISPECIES: restriction endonuclease subunit S [unclassified Empedobacter]|uniref:restriction endonuclease subunit S n=1 Tax=unclassified Empedobacter TaxID=2643773 RepID=UPI0025BDD79B|nr:MULTISPECIES: restriction endonuclease subunit S [unclassified Empedobacter]
MSKLEELLKGVDVEWIKLGNEQFIEIANNGRKPVKASLRSSGEIPYYGANNIQDYVEGFTHDGEYVLIAEDGSSSLENYSIQYANGKFWANNHVHVLKGKNSIETKFLYYYLKIINFTPYLTGGERAKLTKGRMLEIQIPIPPIEIQQEIVRVLDELTTLTNQLTTELETERQNRKKQFEFFREQLFRFEEGKAEWKSLKDVAEYSKKRINFTFLNESNYVGVDNLLQNRGGKINSKHIPTEGNSTAFLTNNILIGNIRPYLKKIWLADCDGGSNGDVLVINIYDKIIHHKYLYHILSSDEFFKYNMQHAKGAKMPRGNKQKIMEYIFPIPSLAEQERIVKLLDQFDATYTAIEEEITKEIKLRTQQYEYYREKLLSLPSLRTT